MDFTQQDLKKLERLYFKQPNILYDHLFSSYHQLVEEIIPYSLTRENNYFYEKVDQNTIYLHGFKCSNIRIKPPTSPSGPDLLSPKEARKKHLKYFATIIADVHQFVEKEDMTTGDKVITLIGEIEKNVSVGSIPIMVKSKYCTTNIKQDLLGECKYEPGGYFIVTGQEKVVMSIEKMVDNKILVFGKIDKTAFMGKAYVSHINSRVDDWSDNLQIINIKFNKMGNMLLSNSQFADIPLFILMRAMGLESDMDIIVNMTYNLEDTEMLNLLRPSISMCMDENDIMIKTKEEAVNYLSTKLKKNKRISATDPFIASIQKKMWLDKILRKDLLPHLGDDLQKKIRFLGLMANKLLQVMLNRRSVDDRDGFDNKRVETPGVLIGQLFRQNWKKSLNEIGKNFKRKNQSDDTPINVVNMIRPTIIEQGIKTAMATGIWGMNRTKKGVAQSLQRLSWILALSNLRRILSPSLDASTSNVVSIRHINNITYGFICPTQTPEGKKIGIVKSLAMMAGITNQNTAQREIIDMILQEKEGGFYYKHPFEIDPIEMNDWSKIMINGDWIGCTKNIYDLYKIMLERKIQGVIDKTTSICMDFEEKELKIYYDAGRMVRPLMNVKDNNVLLTKEFFKEVDELVLKEPTKGWNKLLTKYPTIISYEDIESSKYIMLADNFNSLYDNIKSMESLNEEDSVNRYDDSRFVRYTHMEFNKWTMMGEVSCGIPFINHNYGTKNIVNFSQAKQGIGLYLTNYKDRMDISQVLYHPQEPIVSTEGMQYNNMLNLPAGENAIVAIMSYTGLI
jgi:DNA-directed RNA polymerase II subunit RPB2